MRRSIWLPRCLGDVAEPETEAVAPVCELHDGGIVIVDAGRRLAGDGEDAGWLEIGNTEQKPQRMHKLAPAVPSGPRRIGPG